ncbi:unnamed protein product, partial [Mesorhabditis spiculigera]
MTVRQVGQSPAGQGFNQPMAGKSNNNMVYGLLAAAVAGGGAYAYLRPGRGKHTDAKLHKEKEESKEHGQKEGLDAAQNAQKDKAGQKGQNAATPTNQGPAPRM